MGLLDLNYMTPDPTNPWDGAPPNIPPSVPAPVPGGGDYTKTPIGGGGGGGGATGPGLTGRPSFNIPNAPAFVAPQFRAPSFQDATNEPGFQFRLRGGTDALERSAAARGTLRTGGTLKDIVEYGQNFASSEYTNVFNRALNSFDRTYQGAKDTYAPQLATWQLRGQAEMAAALAQFQREWQMYQLQHQGGGGGSDIPPPPTPPTPPGF